MQKIRELKDIKTNEVGTYIDNPTPEEEEAYGERLPVGFYKMDISKYLEKSNGR